MLEQRGLARKGRSHPVEALSIARHVARRGLSWRRARHQQLFHCLHPLHLFPAAPFAGRRQTWTPGPAAAGEGRPCALGPIQGRPLAASAGERGASRREQYVPGAGTFVQRLGDARNANVHFQSLVLDGVYEPGCGQGPRFLPLPAPDDAEVARVAAQVARKLCRLPEREGLGPEADAADPLAAEEPFLATLTAASISGRTATCPRAGRRSPSARAAVLLRVETAGRNGPTLPAGRRAAALPPQTPLARRHDARRLRAARAHGEARRARAAAACPSRSVTPHPRAMCERPRPRRARLLTLQWQALRSPAPATAMSSIPPHGVRALLWPAGREYTTIIYSRRAWVPRRVCGM